MLISEIIEKLQEIKNKHGDLKVLYADFDFGKDREPTLEVEPSWTDDKWITHNKTVVKIAYE